GRVSRRHRLRHLDLECGRRAVAGAAAGRLGDRLHHGGGGVAEDQRAPGADEVDVGAAVHVPQPRALTALDEQRGAADGSEGADGTVDAARDHTSGGVEHAGGLTHAESSMGTKSRRATSQRNAATASTAPRTTEVTT